MPTQIRRSDFPPQPCKVEQAHPGVVKSGELEHNEALEYDPKKSGATREAAASKSAEHRIAGCAHEAKLRDFQNPTVFVNGKQAEPVLTYDKHGKHDPSIIESTQSPTVQINGKSAMRDDTHCDSSKEPIK